MWAGSGPTLIAVWDNIRQTITVNFISLYKFSGSNSTANLTFDILELQEYQ